MISCNLRGQMGNQMFQVATVIAHALRNKTTYTFPERSGKRDQFPFMFPHLPTRGLEVFDSMYTEEKFGVYSLIPPPQGDQLIQGYFQSELYFKDYRQQIIDTFCVPQFERKQDTCSLHIRRGDYLRWEHKIPQPTKKYLTDAINFFDYGWKFLVFSDDIEWCKVFFKQFGDRFIFCEETNPLRSMGLMNSCQSHIIVNSTFSWWGAWLNEYEHKRVICPDVNSWFTSAYRDRLSAQDIPCKNWIQIPY